MPPRAPGRSMVQSQMLDIICTISERLYQMARSGFPYMISKHKLPMSLISCGTVHRRSWWCLVTDRAPRSVGLLPSVLRWKGSGGLEASQTQGGHRMEAPESLCHECTLTKCQRWYCSGSPPSWPFSTQVFGRQGIRSITVTSVKHGMFRWHQILHCKTLHNDCFQKCLMRLYWY